MSGGMSLFQSQLRSAVQEAQRTRELARPAAAPSERTSRPAEVLSRLAGGEITVDEAIHALELAP
jgi:hypothetical protein